MTHEIELANANDVPHAVIHAAVDHVCKLYPRESVEEIWFQAPSHIVVERFDQPRVSIPYSDFTGEKHDGPL